MSTVATAESVSLSSSTQHLPASTTDSGIPQLQVTQAFKASQQVEPLAAFQDVADEGVESVVDRKDLSLADLSLMRLAGCRTHHSPSASSPNLGFPRPPVQQARKGTSTASLFLDTKCHPADTSMAILERMAQDTAAATSQQLRHQQNEAGVVENHSEGEQGEQREEDTAVATTITDNAECVEDRMTAPQFCFPALRVSTEAEEDSGGSAPSRWLRQESSMGTAPPPPLSTTIVHCSSDAGGNTTQNFPVFDQLPEEINSEVSLSFDQSLGEPRGRGSRKTSSAVAAPESQPPYTDEASTAPQGETTTTELVALVNGTASASAAEAEAAPSSATATATTASHANSTAVAVVHPATGALASLSGSSPLIGTLSSSEMMDDTQQHVVSQLQSLRQLNSAFRHDGSVSVRTHDFQHILSQEQKDALLTRNMRPYEDDEDEADDLLGLHTGAQRKQLGQQQQNAADGVASTAGTFSQRAGFQLPRPSSQPHAVPRRGSGSGIEAHTRPRPSSATQRSADGGVGEVSTPTAGSSAQRRGSVPRQPPAPASAGVRTAPSHTWRFPLLGGGGSSTSASAPATSTERMPSSRHEASTVPATTRTATTTAAGKPASAPASASSPSPLQPVSQQTSNSAGGHTAAPAPHESSSITSEDSQDSFHRPTSDDTRRRAEAEVSPQNQPQVAQAAETSSSSLSTPLSRSQSQHHRSQLRGSPVAPLYKMPQLGPTALHAQHSGKSPASPFSRGVGGRPAGAKGMVAGGGGGAGSPAAVFEGGGPRPGVGVPRGSGFPGPAAGTSPMMFAGTTAADSLYSRPGLHSTIERSRVQPRSLSVSPDLVGLAQGPHRARHSVSSSGAAAVLAASSGSDPSLVDTAYVRQVEMVYAAYKRIYGLRQSESQTGFHGVGQYSRGNSVVDLPDARRSKRASPSVSCSGLGRSAGYYSFGNRISLSHPNRQAVAAVPQFLGSMSNVHSSEAVTSRRMTTVEQRIHTQKRLSVRTELVERIKQRPLLQTTLFLTHNMSHIQLQAQQREQQQHQQQQQSPHRHGTTTTTTTHVDVQSCSSLEAHSMSGSGTGKSRSAVHRRVGQQSSPKAVGASFSTTTTTTTTTTTMTTQMTVSTSSSHMSRLQVPAASEEERADTVETSHALSPRHEEDHPQHAGDSTTFRAPGRANEEEAEEGAGETPLDGVSSHGSKRPRAGQTGTLSDITPSPSSAAMVTAGGDSFQQQQHDQPEDQEPEQTSPSDGTATTSTPGAGLSRRLAPQRFHRALTAVTQFNRHVHSIDNVEREVDNETGDLVVYVGMRLMGWLEVVSLLGCGSFGQVFLCKDLRICDGYFVHPSEIDGEDFAYWNCCHAYLPFGDCGATPTHPPLVAVKVVKSVPLLEHQSVLEAEMLVLIGAQTDANGTRPQAAAASVMSDPPPSDPRCTYVAKVLADGVSYGHHCIVMERYGANLYEYIASNNHVGLPMYQIRSIGRQLLSALSLIHQECHIIHADIKPENMLLTMDSCRSSVTNNRIPRSSPDASASPGSAGAAGKRRSAGETEATSAETDAASDLNPSEPPRRHRRGEGSTGPEAGAAGAATGQRHPKPSSMEGSFITLSGGCGAKAKNAAVVVEGGRSLEDSLRGQSYRQLAASAREVAVPAPEPRRVHALNQPQASAASSGYQSVRSGMASPSAEEVVAGGGGVAGAGAGASGLSSGPGGSAALESIPKLRVKLIDFSSSCYDGGPFYTYIQSRYYRAPEVILNANYGPAIDLWSTGCVLAELLVGMPLLPGCNEHHQLALIEEMIGPIAPSVLEQGAVTQNFYERVCAPPAAPAVVAGGGQPVSTPATQVSNGPPSQSPSDASATSYRLISKEAFLAQNGLAPVEYMRYFTLHTMQELVRHCPLTLEERRMSHGLAPYVPASESSAIPAGATPAPSIRSEMLKQRFLLFDLLRQLLSTNPAERPTAQQALAHPFFTCTPPYMTQFMLD